MFPLPAPVLALDISQIFGLVVFTLTALSYFVNLIKGDRPNAAPRPKNRPREQVQSDLEKFLQEIVGNQKQQEKKRPAPQQVPQQKQQQQQRQANAKNGGKAKSQQPRPPKPEPIAQRPGERVAASHLQTSAMGQGVRSHLHEFMEPNRIGAAVQQDIDSAVRRDLGPTAAKDAVVRAGNIHPLAQALRDPQGVRQAILLNEILSRPKSLRR